MSKELQRLMDNVKEWQENTFGENNSDTGKAFHLQKETVELTEALLKHKELGTFETLLNLKEEFADCLILIVGCAEMNGIYAQDLLTSCFIKLEIVKKRTWSKPDKNGVCQHIKE